MHHHNLPSPLPQAQPVAWHSPANDTQVVMLNGVRLISDACYPVSLRPGSRNLYRDKTVVEQDARYLVTFPRAMEAFSTKCATDATLHAYYSNDQSLPIYDVNLRQDSIAVQGFLPPSPSMNLSTLPPRVAFNSSSLAGAIDMKNVTPPASSSISSQSPNMGREQPGSAQPSDAQLTSPLTPITQAPSSNQVYTGPSPGQDVPSQEFSRPLASNGFLDSAPSLPVTVPNPNGPLTSRYAHPPAPTASLAMDRSAFAPRIIPNPNLAVQDIVIPTNMRSTLPPPPPATYSTSYAPHGQPYPPAPGSYQPQATTFSLPLDQSQNLGSSGSYAHGASQRDEGAVVVQPPGWSPLPGATTPASTLTPSPSPPVLGPNKTTSTRKKKSPLVPKLKAITVRKTAMKIPGEKKKPHIACHFCRGRKIACGPPLPGGDGHTCNQCSRRGLICTYPDGSRRGQRTKPSIAQLALRRTDSPKRAAKAARNRH